MPMVAYDGSIIEDPEHDEDVEITSEAARDFREKIDEQARDVRRTAEALMEWTNEGAPSDVDKAINLLLHAADRLAEAREAV